MQKILQKNRESFAWTGCITTPALVINAVAVAQRWLRDTRMSHRNITQHHRST